MRLVLEDYLTGIRKDFGNCQNANIALKVMREYLNALGMSSPGLIPKARDETTTEYYFGTETKVFVLEQ